MTSHQNKVLGASFPDLRNTPACTWSRVQRAHTRPLSSVGPRKVWQGKAKLQVLTCEGQGGGGCGCPGPATQGHAFPCVPHHHQLTTDPRAPCPCKTLQNPLQMDPSFQHVHIFCRRRQAPPFAKPRYLPQCLPARPAATVKSEALWRQARPSPGLP